MKRSISRTFKFYRIYILIIIFFIVFLGIFVYLKNYGQYTSRLDNVSGSRCNRTIEKDLPIKYVLPNDWKIDSIGCFVNAPDMNSLTFVSGEYIIAVSVDPISTGVSDFTDPFLGVSSDYYEYISINNIDMEYSGVNIDAGFGRVARLKPTKAVQEYSMASIQKPNLHIMFGFEFVRGQFLRKIPLYSEESGNRVVTTIDYGLPVRWDQKKLDEMDKIVQSIKVK